MSSSSLAAAIRRYRASSAVTFSRHFFSTKSIQGDTPDINNKPAGDDDAANSAAAGATPRQDDKKPGEDIPAATAAGEEIPTAAGDTRRQQDDINNKPAGDVDHIPAAAGATPRQDDKKPGEEIPAATAAGEEIAAEKAQGKQVAGQGKVKIHLRVNDDAEPGEDPQVAATFEAMKKEGNTATNKGAFYTWLEALNKDLADLSLPFTATYQEVRKQFAKKGYQDTMVRSFEVPPGLPISIRLTPLDELQIRGGNKEDGTFISYDWQLPRNMYFDKANFSHKFYDKYLIVVITDIEPKPTLILKKASS